MNRSFDAHGLRARLANLIVQRGWTANAWSAEARLPEATLRAFLNGKILNPRIATLTALAAAADMTVGELLGEAAPARRISIVGYVGAGAEVFAIDDHAQGAGLDDAPAPPDAGPSMVAVRVRGASMLPVFHDGDVLYYDRDPLVGVDDGACLDRECVVQLANDGPTLVKLLRKGSREGRYTLESYNTDEHPEPLRDRALDWAAPVQFTDRRGPRPRRPAAQRSLGAAAGLTAAGHPLDAIGGTVLAGAGARR